MVGTIQRWSTAFAKNRIAQSTAITARMSFAVTEAWAAV